MDDCPVESEDVECLQAEVLGIQQCGEDGLHTVRAEVRLPRQQRLQPGGGLGQTEQGDFGQAKTVARDVQVAQLEVSRLVRSGQVRGRVNINSIQGL